MKREALEPWLEAANRRYGAEGLPHRGRPFRALSDFSKEHKCSIRFDAPIAKAIFDWFYAHSPPGSHAIGSLFTGAFFFDASFWPLNIPIGYGTFKLNVIESLSTMPLTVRNPLEANAQDMKQLALYWVDCCDYAYGRDCAGKLTTNAQLFFQNADRELVGAIAQLITPRPNTKAILALRLSTEIVMKALLIQEKNITTPQLKKLGHNIQQLADECLATTGIAEFKIISNLAEIFPDVSQRYDGPERTMSEAWTALTVAQIAATAIVRKYSGRDMRPQILRQFN